MANISEKLKKLLLENAMSASELSRASGVHISVVFRILSGETPRPRISTIKKLADALGVPTAPLLMEEPTVTNEEKPYSQQIARANLERHGENLIPLYETNSFTRSGAITGDALEMLPFPSLPCSKKATVFAVQVADDASSPTLAYLSIALVRKLDLADCPCAGALVLAFGRTSEQPIIRQLGMSQARKPILTATNPQFFGPPLEECERVLGTVIGEFKLLNQPYL